MARPPLPAHWQVSAVVGMRSRAFKRIETVGANRGFVPDYVTTHNGGQLADYYCMHAVAETFAEVLGHASPLLMSGSCSQQRTRAKAKGAIITRAEFDRRRKAAPMSVAGLVFLVIDTIAADDGVGLPGHAHHTGIVGDIDQLTAQIIVNGPRGGFLSIDANASDPEQPASRNGDGWYHGRERGHVADPTTYEFIVPDAFPL